MLATVRAPLRSSRPVQPPIASTNPRRRLPLLLLVVMLPFALACPPEPPPVGGNGPRAGATAGHAAKTRTKKKNKKGAGANGPAESIGPAGPPRLEAIPWPGVATGADLLAVAALSSSQAIAVGVPGAVWIDAAKGTVRVAPFSDGIADAIWADGPDFAVAVGYGGIAHLWDGRAWSDAPTGIDADLEAVFGRETGGVRQVFAGGSKGTILSLGPEGHWTKMAAPDNVTISAFSASGDKVWAVGFVPAGDGSDGVILRLDGDRWVDACHDLACDGAIYAVWAAGAGDLWTGGARGELVHYTALQPELLKSGTRATITSIWGTSATDVFVAGNAGFLLHWSGTSWAPLAVGNDDIRAIGGLPTGEAWVVGASGLIRHVVRGTPGG